MNNYKVSATSHISCVKFTINTEISEAKVLEVLADGVLYNTQRSAASQVCKGRGKRNEIAFTPEFEAAVEAALVKLFPNAEITTSEYVPGATTVDKKFVQVRSVLKDKLASGAATIEEIADRAGFDGDIFDEETGDYSQEFLVAMDVRIKALAKQI